MIFYFNYELKTHPITILNQARTHPTLARALYSLRILFLDTAYINVWVIL